LVEIPLHVVSGAAEQMGRRALGVEPERLVGVLQGFVGLPRFQRGLAGAQVFLHGFRPCRRDGSQNNQNQPTAVHEGSPSWGPFRSIVVEDWRGRLGNTRSTCRSGLIHPAVLDAYRDSSLVRTQRQRIEGEVTGSLSKLSPEEAAVMAFLQERLKREAG